MTGERGSAAGAVVGRDPDLEAELAAGLARLEAAELRRGDRAMRRLAGGEVEIEGRRVADFASNDYLGLGPDPRVARAGADAFVGEGAGAGAARLISGTHPLHLQLERALAAFKGHEAALLFGSGYAANLGVVPALVGRHDLLYSDELNHASLFDGCRISLA
jgi:7-keto-8-aminopelargonate synthetase-like enzyme